MIERPRISAYTVLNELSGGKIKENMPKKTLFQSRVSQDPDDRDPNNV